MITIINCTVPFTLAPCINGYSVSVLYLKTSDWFTETVYKSAKHRNVFKNTDPLNKYIKPVRFTYKYL